MIILNGYFLAAAVICFLLGLVHSVLGEKLIFHRWRQGRRHQQMPIVGTHLLHESQIGILWASWHLVSLFGWAISAVLLYLSLAAPAQVLINFIAHTVTIASLAGAICVFIGTRAKHPGWVGLLAISVCAWLGGLG